jgi:uracil-DNA glycosylase
LTENVRAWGDYGPNLLPLPHPSPRNNIWLWKNPWFEAEIVPA